jgi:hypothetical protein
MPMGVLREWDGKQLTDGVRRLVHGIKTEGLGHQPWSVCEIGFDDQDVSLLRSWFQQLSSSTAMHALGCDDPLLFDEHPLWFGTHVVTFRTGISLLLLCFFAEQARRTATEGCLWPVFRTLGIPDTMEYLFGPPTRTAGPHADVKRGLEETCSAFHVRNAFSIPDTHAWYLTIFLQFGYTLRGIQQRLPSWLDNQTLSHALELLLHDPTMRSERLDQFWSHLRAFRYRQQTTLQTRMALEHHPWRPPMPLDQLLTFVGQVSESNDFFTNLSSLPELPSPLEDCWVSPPVLGGVAERSPHFTCNLLLDAIEQDVPTLHVLANGQRIALLNRQPDGTYRCPTGEQLLLPWCSDVHLQLRDSHHHLLLSQHLVLWDEESDIEVFSAHTGLRFPDPYHVPWKSHLSYWILIHPALRCEPSLPGVPIHQQRLLTWKLATHPQLALYFENEMLWLAELRPSTTAKPRELSDPERIQVRIDQPQFQYPGESCTLRIVHPEGMSIASIRYRTQRFFPTKVSKQASLVSLTIPASIPKQALEITIDLRWQGQSYLLKKTVALELQGTVFFKDSLWVRHEDSRDLERWDAELTPCKTWVPQFFLRREPRRSLVAGTMFCSRWSAHSRTIGTVPGLGEPLWIQPGLPHCPSPQAKLPHARMKICNRVLDHGVIDNVSLLPTNQALLTFKTPLELSAEHYLLVIDHSGDCRLVPGPETQAVSPTCIELSLPCSATKVAVLALVFHGCCLGSWWSDAWGTLLTQSSDLPTVAVLIRWLQLPIHDEGLSRAFQTLTRHSSAMAICLQPQVTTEFLFPNHPPWPETYLDLGDHSTWLSMLRGSWYPTSQPPEQQLLSLRKYLGSHSSTADDQHTTSLLFAEQLMEFRPDWLPHLFQVDPEQNQQEQPWLEVLIERKLRCPPKQVRDAAYLEKILQPYAQRLSLSLQQLQHYVFLLLQGGKPDPELDVYQLLQMPAFRQAVAINWLFVTWLQQRAMPLGTS